MCSPVHVCFPLSASQTGQMSNQKQWFQCHDAITKKETDPNASDIISCQSRDAVAIVFSIYVPHALKCVHKNGHWTRHWNYMAHVPKQIPDTRNNATLWNTKDIKFTLCEHTLTFTLHAKWICMKGPKHLVIWYLGCNILWATKYLFYFFYLTQTTVEATLQIQLHKPKSASKPACTTPCFQNMGVCLSLAVYTVCWNTTSQAAYWTTGLHWQAGV